jgi:DNA-binding response OmpR family regulator
VIDTSYSDAGILVIDADADAVRYLVRTLKEAGYDSVQACTDPAVLTNCLEDKALDLIVLDVSEREPEGLALLQDLRRQIPPDDFLPVMAIGTGPEPTARIKAMQAGAKEYMRTPLDAEEFLARVLRNCCGAGPESPGRATSNCSSVSRGWPSCVTTRPAGIPPG